MLGIRFFKDIWIVLNYSVHIDKKLAKSIDICITCDNKIKFEIKQHIKTR